MHQSSINNCLLNGNQPPMNGSVAQPLRGIIPPLVTPLTEEGALDVLGLHHAIDHVLAGGVHALFILGTSGEAVCLSQSVRLQVVEETCRYAKGRVPILVGITDTSFEHTLMFAHAAAEQGANAVVVSTPYYFSLEQAELIHYIQKVTTEVSLPIYLYNIPELTGTEFGAETVRKLAELPQIIGIKDSSGNREYLSAIREAASDRPDWSLLVGSDDILVESVMDGFHGGVSGSANVWPQLLVHLYEAASQVDQDRCRSLQTLLFDLMTIFQFGGYGIGVVRGTKYALEIMGICSGRLATPFAGCNKEQQLWIENKLTKLNLLQNGTAHSTHQIPTPHLRHLSRRNPVMDGETRLAEDLGS